MRYTYLVDLLNCEIGEPDLPGKQVRDTYPVNRCGTLTWKTGTALTAVGAPLSQHVPRVTGHHTQLGARTLVVRTRVAGRGLYRHNCNTS